MSEKKKNRTGIEWFAEELLANKPKALEALFQSGICPFAECPFGYLDSHCTLEEAEECWSITEEEIEEVEVAYLEEMFKDFNLVDEDDEEKKKQH